MIVWGHIVVRLFVRHPASRFECKSSEVVGPIGFILNKMIGHEVVDHIILLF